ncbi:MAG: TraX family protein [Oscillospiraceae bacterium]|nr:TraX family protein [Oscillospiraceae bacterium]
MKELTDKIRQGVISGNALKLFALLCMTVDHIGVHLISEYEPIRIIGRLAFPIFAYMIAEGCKYTKNKLKYFLTIFIEGVILQIFIFLMSDSTHMNVLITFSLSIGLIYAFDYSLRSENNYNWVIPLTGIIFVMIICGEMPEGFLSEYFHIDYGFFGVMLPVMVYIFDNKVLKLLMFTLGLVFLSMSLAPIQWWCLLSVIPIALYSGKRGKLKIKYLFHIYYPLHIVIILAIKELLGVL